MKNEIVLPILTLLFGGISVEIFNYYAGKKRELEQHQRERREDQYGKLLQGLQGFFDGTANIDTQKEFNAELNTNALIFASSKVIRLGNAYLAGFAENKKLPEELDKIADALVLAIRKELKVDEKDPLTKEGLVRYKIDPV